MPAQLSMNSNSAILSIYVVRRCQSNRTHVVVQLQFYIVPDALQSALFAQDLHHLGDARSLL